MSDRYHVEANWDDEAKVWISSSNIPGLVIEAASLPEFVELAQALAPELLSDNLGISDPVLIEFRATELSGATK